MVLTLTSLGFSISFAMELFEKGILTSDDGYAINFGDADGVAELIINIALRKGLGSLLAEGTRMAAGLIGKGSIRICHAGERFGDGSI